MHKPLNAYLLRQLKSLATITLFFLLPNMAFAVCNDHTPVSGSSVTCNGDAPNPDPVSVISPTGASNNNLTVQPNSGLTVNSGNAVSLADGSTVENAGTISGRLSGITFRQGNNAVINSGTISATAGPAITFNGSGNNLLINSGTLNGAGATTVKFGAGADSFVMNGGQINGNLDQGSGNDSAVINGGNITGNLAQGSGIDDFVMHGGTLGSLAQGDNRDTFTMTGGSITGAFIDGDVATMSGGSIGRVDMKLDNNIFTLTGGQIVGNLVTGFGNDTITVTQGTIGGNISVSGGTDSVTVTGGNIKGQILMSSGNDSFLWQQGGIIQGAILMGNDNDRATLRDLSINTLASTPQLDGGSGNDTLTLDNAIANNPARFTQWETINLQNHAALFLSSPLVLGDATTQTGALNIDNQSLLYGGAGDSQIAPYTAGQWVTLHSSGTLDLTHGSTSTSDTLTLYGNYIGDNAVLKLQTQLGDENSPTDRFIISRGEASGTTQIQLTNINGQGAYTAGNGIELISAINNATTRTGAFDLAGGTVSAGAYEYVLFRGGVTPGSEENWYLRNQLIAPALTNPPSPPPENPTLPPVEQQPVVAIPQAAPGSPALPAAQPGSDPVPLYRPETPLYSALMPVALDLGIFTVGTFHQRQGSQRLLSQDNDMPATWSRVEAQHHQQQWSGDATPGFRGNLATFQVGQDLWSSHRSNGPENRAGVFYSYSSTRGDANGMILGFKNQQAGSLRLNANSFGGYWTHLLENRAYIDAVAAWSWLDGSLDSVRGLGGDIHGHMLTASVEMGWPLPVSEHWSIEPQAQMIAQHATLDTLNDGIATVNWGSGKRYSGRVGARLAANYGVIEPWLQANVWHTFQHSGEVTLGEDVIRSQQENTALQLAVGIAARISEETRIYASFSHMSDVDSQHRRDDGGSVGVRISW
ncbi:autotransporter family protein [Pantoea sp. A4]|uniref:autotransporter family protein n=1 Tax=Pantoea sp. A4 TaxID=1225184 RepID=UPI00036512C8|nr:autotransporter domain-containing protein [Pantoea sp. A4]